MAPRDKHCTFLHHSPVSVDWLYCLRGSRPKFWASNTQSVKPTHRTCSHQSCISFIFLNGTRPRGCHSFHVQTPEFAGIPFFLEFHIPESHFPTLSNPLNTQLHAQLPSPRSCLCCIFVIFVLFHKESGMDTKTLRYRA